MKDPSKSVCYLAPRTIEPKNINEYGDLSKISKFHSKGEMVNMMKNISNSKYVLPHRPLKILGHIQVESS